MDLAFLLAAVVLSLAIHYVFGREKRRPLPREMRRAPRTEASTPQVLVLSFDRTAARSPHHPSDQIRAVAALLARGFVGVGAFRPRELPDCHVHVLASAELGIYATVTDRRGHAPSVELVTRHTDGTVVAYTNAVQPMLPAPRGTSRIIVPEAPIHVLFDRFRFERPYKTRRSHLPVDAVRDLAHAWSSALPGRRPTPRDEIDVEITFAPEPVTAGGRRM